MKTASTCEQPKIWLIANDPFLFNSLKNELERKDFTVSVSQCDDDGYKNLLVLNGEENKAYIDNQLNILKRSSLPSTVVLPIVGYTKDFSQQYWNQLFESNQTLIKTIVKNLPAAKIILVNGWIFENWISTYSSPLLCLNSFPLLNAEVPGGVISIIENASVISSVIRHVSQPHSSRSVLLSGSQVLIKDFITVCSRLYESYHNVSINLSLSGELIVQPLPFNFSEEVVDCDIESVCKKIARSMSGPTSQTLIEIVNSLSIRGDEHKKEVIKASFDNSRYILNNIKKNQLEQSLDVQKPEGFYHKDGEAFGVSSNKCESINKGDPETNSVAKLSIESSSVDDHDVDPFNQLDSIFKLNRVESKEEKVGKIITQEKKGAKKNNRRKGFFILGAISSGLAVGIIFLASLFFVNKHLFILGLISRLDISDNTFQIKDSSFVEKWLERTLALQTNIYQYFVEGDVLDRAHSSLKISEKLNQLANLLEEQATTTNSLQNSLGNSNSLIFSNALQSAQLVLDNKITEQAELIAMLKSFELSDSWNSSLLTLLQNSLEEDKKNSSYLVGLMPVLPNILGENGEKTYAILLLDSSEIRPTGGYIQAVALVKIEYGQIISTKVFSSYEVDEKLGGVIEPPQDLSNLLNEDSWYFRDSNWDPDNLVSSERISWFLEKSLKTKVDGIIGVSTQGFSELLASVEPLNISKFNESITKNNVFERMLFYNEATAQENKESFSVALLEEFLDTLSTKDFTKVMTVVKLLSEQLESGDITFVSFSQEENDVLQALRWTGGIVRPVCPTQFSKVPCSIDYVYQVESNIGVNKVNRFVSRSVNHVATIGIGVVDHVRETVISNNSSSNAWPLGTYRLYFKTLIPRGSRVKGVYVDGEQVSSKDLQIKTNRDLDEIALLVNVPIKETRSIRIEYQTKVETSLPHSYLLFDQKQPGISRSSSNITLLRSDRGLAKRVAPEPSVVGDNKLVFDQKFGLNNMVLVEYKP